jgi:SSS family solute:Na+ symporter
MNSIATAWTKDFDGRVFRPEANDQQYLFSAKVVVVVGGILGIAVALWFENSGIENAFKTFLGITGLVTGSLGGVFALGVFTKKGNATGAIVGAVAGIAAVATVKFAKLPVTGILYALIGLMTCFVVGYVVSLCTRRDEREGLSVHG